MNKNLPESQFSADESLIFPASTSLNSAKSPTIFQQAVREDYLYSQNSDDSYYYEQRPPHWKN